MIYVISDIHGMYDALKNLIWQLEDIGDVSELIFLGDYIDYGPSSKEVLDFLIELQYPKTFLAGNHEDLLLQYIHKDIRDRHFSDSFWLSDNEGERTVRSLVGKYSMERNARGEYGSVESKNIWFNEKLEKRYLDFFNNLQYSIRREINGQRYLFTHANVLDNGKEDIRNYFDKSTYTLFHAYLHQQNIYGALSPMNYRPYKEYEPMSSQKVAHIDDYIVIHGHTPVCTINGLPEVYNKHCCPCIETNVQYDCNVKCEAEYIGEETVLQFDIDRSDICSVNIDTGAVLGQRLSAFGIDNEKSAKRRNSNGHEYTVVQALTNTINKNKAWLRRYRYIVKDNTVD